MSGFLKNGVDLDTIFEPRGTTSARANTGFQVNGVDLAQRFYNKALGGNSPAATGFQVGGTDISTMFAAKGSVSYNPSWSGIISRQTTGGTVNYCGGQNNTSPSNTKDSKVLTTVTTINGVAYLSSEYFINYDPSTNTFSGRMFPWVANPVDGSQMFYIIGGVGKLEGWQVSWDHYYLGSWDWDTAVKKGTIYYSGSNGTFSGSWTWSGNYTVTMTGSNKSIVAGGSGAGSITFSL